MPPSTAVFRRESTWNRVIPNLAVIEFHDWAQSGRDGWQKIHEMFLKENGNPAGGYHAQHGSQGMRGITRSRWVELLMSNGFKSDIMAEQVFDEIAKELPSDAKGKAKDAGDGPEEPVIKLAQLTRFELKCTCVTATLPGDHTQSATSRFIKLLRQSRGTTLRAWRLDLDRRGTGRVAFPDFCTTCRELGLGPQGKLVWYNARQDRVTPLELHEVDAKEANNLELLAEILWETVGFDMAKAWQFLDVNNQNFLTFAEFQAGVRKLGYQGDAKLLFRGLDAAGLGRLKFEDLEYVRRISRIAFRQLGGASPVEGAVKELIIWVQRELGGAHQLMGKLGLAGASTIVVADFAARLTALGFPGDALRAASLLARTEGGNAISGDTILSVLGGGKPKSPATGSRSRSMPSSPRTGKLSPRSVGTGSNSNCNSVFERGVWCDSVDDKSVLNSAHCKYTRNYFTPPARLEEKSLAASAAMLPPESPRAKPCTDLTPNCRLATRPPWNDNFDAVMQHSNQHMSSHNRRYFSNFDDKPVRAERRRLIQDRMRAQRDVKAC